MKGGRIGDGESTIGAASQFQFKVATWSEMGHSFKGGNSGDSRGWFGEDTSKSNSDYGVFQHGVDESIDIQFLVDRNVGWIPPTDSISQMPILCSVILLECLTKKRMLERQPILTFIMGNKLVQAFRPTMIFNLLVLP
ncbi:hypothetical protein ACB092_01G318600 [Castanea dentata]